MNCEDTISQQQPGTLSEGAAAELTTGRAFTEHDVDNAAPDPRHYVWDNWPSVTEDRVTKLRRQLAELTPDDDTLREWARRPKNRPPQSWWEADDNPLEPEDS